MKIAYMPKLDTNMGRKSNKILQNIWGVLGLADTCLIEIVDPAGSVNTVCFYFDRP